MVSQSLLEDFVQTMPKKLLQVGKFEGGINNNSSPTDISDNEFQVANDIIVGKVGKVVLMGDIKGTLTDPPAAQTLDFSPGSDLISFESDRSGTGVYVPAGVTNYVTVNGTNLMHWDSTTNTWRVIEASLTADTGFSISWHAGALRYSDKGLSDGRGWWGYISRTHFLGTTPISGTSALVFSGMFQSNANIVAPVRALVGVLSGPADSDGDETTLNTSTNSFNSCSVEIAAAEALNTDYVCLNLTDSQWATAVSCTDEVMTTTALTSSADWDAHGAGGVDSYDIYPPKGGIAIDATIATSGGYIPPGTYKIGVTFVYDEGYIQESNILEAGGELLLNGSNSTHLLSSIRVKFQSDGVSSPAYNPRISGSRIYIQDIGDKSKTWHLVTDISLHEGYRTNMDNDFEGTWVLSGAGTHASAGELIYISLAESYKSLSATTYQNINGYRPNEPIDVMYKTSTIVNGIFYAGNVKQGFGAIGSPKIYPDRMIKCATTRNGIAYDVFPESHFIDIATNDGDDIVRLDAFSDKVMQFKRRSLFVVNYSEGVGDFIENEFLGMGIAHPAQAFKTPHGIVFINKAGCFLYSGDNLVNLTSKIDDKFDSRGATYASYNSAGNSFFNSPFNAELESSYGEGSQMIGDIDGDGAFTENDASMVAQYSVELISLTEWQKYRADTDGNEIINAHDASRISRVVQGNMNASELHSGRPIPTEDEWGSS